MPRRFVKTVKPDFAGLVLDWKKSTTIRPVPKRKLMPGDVLSLAQWEGAPYRSHQIPLVDVPVTAVDDIRITPFESVYLNGKLLTGFEVDELAAEDGFLSVFGFYEFFALEYGKQEFRGIRITWPAKALEIYDKLGLAWPYYREPIEDPEMRGWNGIPNGMVRDCIAFCKGMRHAVFVEVGSYMGHSTCLLASALKGAGFANWTIICIDTWLSSFEHMLRGKDKFSAGTGQLYETFRANIMKQGHQANVIPLPTTSAIGAQLLKAAKINPDLAYIDGSHDERSITNDLDDYSHVPIIWGDDWNKPVIRKVVERFASPPPDGGSASLEAEEPYFWRLRP